MTDPTPRPSAEGAARERIALERDVRGVIDSGRRGDQFDYGRLFSAILSALEAAEERGAAREREECTRLAEERYADEGWHDYYQTAGRNIAEAIRARASADELLKGEG